MGKITMKSLSINKTFLNILASILKQNYGQVHNRQFQTLVGMNALMSLPKSRTKVFKFESMFKQVFSLICGVCGCNWTPC